MKAMTRSGREIDLTNPMPEDISLSDIVVPLANMPRYNCQSVSMLSVAAHSIALSRVVPGPLRAAALLHDSAEAYTGDIPATIKELLPSAARMILTTVEHHILLAIQESLQISFIEQMADLKKYDIEIRDVEKLILYGQGYVGAGCLIEHNRAHNCLRSLMAKTPHQVALEYIIELVDLSPQISSRVAEMLKSERLRDEKAGAA